METILFVACPRLVQWFFDLLLCYHSNVDANGGHVANSTGVVEDTIDPC